MASLERLAIHTITTKSWDLPTACSRYAAAGVRGVGLWRQWLEGRPLSESRKLLDDVGLRAVSLVRGGFFAHSDPARRAASFDDNLRAIEEAVATGAPQIVLVCGADPAQSLPENRKQIAQGLADLIPHASAAGVRLAIEPLHPMYADCRSAVNTMAQCNDLIDQLGSETLGIAADVYHIWWDPNLSAEIQRAGQRIIAFHVCDWLTPTTDFLNDRGLMGEGCIDLRGIRQEVEAAGFHGPIEVEIFSERLWRTDPDQYLQQIIERFQTHT
ncbi:MAG: sugar phosphate isomerase/epimerase family protein [Puniceicoccaceae bacterium]